MSADKPSLTVRASTSKNHRLACLPLHPALVAALVQFRPANAQPLVKRLDAYVRGNRKAFAVVRVPTEQEEQERTVSTIKALISISRKKASKPVARRS